MKVPAPIIVSVAVTNQCNLKCVHCFPDAGATHENELTVSEIMHVVRQASDMGVFIMAYTGGEVFMKEGIMNVFRLTDELGMKVAITTNGTLVQDAHVLELTKMDVRVIRISLDAPTAKQHDGFRGQRGSFETTCKTIRMLARSGLPVEVQSTVSRFNVHQIDSMVNLAIELGARAYNTSILTLYGRATNLRRLELLPAELRQFYIDQIKRRNKYKGTIDVKASDPLTHLLPTYHASGKAPIRSCPAAMSVMEIAADGSASPCLCIPVKGQSVREQSLREIWFDSDLFKSIRDRSKMQGKCSVCSHLSECGGGCHAAAYVATGDIHRPDPHCWYAPEGWFETAVSTQDPTLLPVV